MCQGAAGRWQGHDSGGRAQTQQPSPGYGMAQAASAHCQRIQPASAHPKQRTWHRSNVGAAVATDLGFVPHATQADSLEWPAQHICRQGTGCQTVRMSAKAAVAAQQVGYGRDTFRRLPGNARQDEGLGCALSQAICHTISCTPSSNTAPAMERASEVLPTPGGPMKHRMGARASQPLCREGAWCRPELGGSSRLDDWKEAAHHPMAYSAGMQRVPHPAARMHGHGPQCPSTHNHPSAPPAPHRRRCTATNCTMRSLILSSP